MRGRSFFICTAFAALAAIVSAGCGSTPGSHDRQWSLDDGPDEELRPRDILPETHLAAGRLHESQGQLAGAAEQYHRAIAVDPKTIEAYNRLGNLYIRSGQHKEAEKIYQQAIRIAPEQAHLYNNLGFCHTLQKRWEQAIAMFRKALEINPSFDRAHVNLAMALAQQDRFEEALEHFQAALPPDSAHFNMGLMYQSRSRDVDAARAYQAALEANPNFAAARKRLDKFPPSVIQEARQRRHVPEPQPVPASSLQEYPNPSLHGHPQSQPAATSQPTA
jgi:tetratricopeptide (TPR) repeat protein